MDLVVESYAVTQRRPFCGDLAPSDPLHRAAVPVLSTIAEGVERGSRAEFHRFLSIAKASCAELKTHLHLARRLESIDETTFITIHAKADEVGRILGGLRAKVGSQRATPKR